MQKINYGPLQALIGVWEGDKGVDLSPEPGGGNESRYRETITFEPAGDVTNFQRQKLVALHYRKRIKRLRDNADFHDETGYLIWDEQEKIVMQTLTIPRAVNVLAMGTYRIENPSTVLLEFYASSQDDNHYIGQSPLMRQNAQTKTFRHSIHVSQDKLSYCENKELHIYGEAFEHIDTNTLTKR